MMCVRWSHHDKPANPINPPPNDHLNFKVQTLDDLPKPDLDYYAYYAQQQKKYWLHLIFGSACLGATLYYVSILVFTMSTVFIVELCDYDIIICNLIADRCTLMNPYTSMLFLLNYLRRKKELKAFGLNLKMRKRMMMSSYWNRIKLLFSSSTRCFVQ